MEPTHNSFSGSHELPQPQEAVPNTTDEEQPAAAPEQQTQVAAPRFGVLPPQNDPHTATTTFPAQHTDPQPASSSSNTQHLMADDADLIEKEWVTKAKAIVAQTKDDPYQQNQEMTKVKADYLKKRYNKDLKVSET